MVNSDLIDGSPEAFLVDPVREMANNFMFGMIAAGQGNMVEARMKAGRLPALMGKAKSSPFGNDHGVVRLIEAGETLAEVLERIGLVGDAGQ